VWFLVFAQIERVVLGAFVLIEANGPQNFDIVIMFFKEIILLSLVIIDVIKGKTIEISAQLFNFGGSFTPVVPCVCEARDDVAEILVDGDVVFGSAELFLE